MQHPTNTYDSLKTFVRALGGSLDDDDITSAANIEGGKSLLAWLAHQAAFPDEATQVTNTILWDVALEKDEIPLCVSSNDFSTSFGTNFYSPTTVAPLTLNSQMTRKP